jgi:hypothetical protein
VAGEISVGELVATLTLNDLFSGAADKTKDTIDGMGESFKAVTGLAVGIAGAIAGATTAVVMLGERGAAVADVRGQFEDLTERAGESADVMLGALREGTLGTISNFDLMKMSAGVLGSGLVRTKDEMHTLAAGAQLLADRTGGDTAAAFETLTGAMEKGKTKGLEQLGIFVDSKTAIEQYAISVGKAAGDLTRQEQAAAVNQATLAALRREIEANGGATADFGDQIARGKVAVQNFTDNLAVAVATSPVVAAGMDAVAEALEGAFGGDQQTMVQTLMGWVNEFAIKLTYAGQIGTTAATVLVTAWYAVKTAILAVLGVATDQVAKMTELIAKGAEYAAQIPGVGQGVKDLAVSARDLADGMAGASKSLQDQTAEAVRGVMGQSELQASIDKVGGTLINMRERMEAARDATAGMTEQSGTAAGKITEVGAAAALTAEQLKAIEEQTRKGQEVLVETQTEALELYNRVQQEISLAQTTGIEQRLLELDIARQTEIAGVQHLAFMYPEIYDQITAAITEKYRIMTDTARGFHTDIAVQAANAGFRTREEMQRTADVARQTYEEMKESGKFTYSELQRAHKAAKDAEDAINKSSALTATQQFDLIATAAKTILRGVFGNSKAAAIAVSLIDTAQAVVKALASAPPPFNYALAAAVGAAGLVQTNKIRSTDAGFAEGTPGTAFLDFGRESFHALHNREAVVTPKQSASVGEMLQGMVGDELRRREDRTAAEVRALREDLADDRRALPYRLRDAVLTSV